MALSTMKFIFNKNFFFFFFQQEILNLTEGDRQNLGVSGRPSAGRGGYGKAKAPQLPQSRNTVSVCSRGRRHGSTGIARNELLNA